MKRVLTLLSLAGAFVLTSAMPANAASVTFNLDCRWSGNDCDSAGPYGTVKLTDVVSPGDPNHILIEVLLNDSDYLLERLYLNFVPSPAIGSGDRTWGGSGINDVTYDPDDVGPSNDSEVLDLRINPDGQPNSWTSTLYFSINPSGPNNTYFYNLDVEDFTHWSQLISNGSEVWAAALLLKKDDCRDWKNGQCKEWNYEEKKVGSLTQASTLPPPATPVPEPSTLALMGAGLLGAARKLRTRFGIRK